MTRCGCASSGCDCQIVAGEGATVTGTGSRSNPYIVSAPPTTIPPSPPGTANDNQVAGFLLDEAPSATFTAMRQTTGRLSVQTFGADPTGVADSTLAFTRAITAASTTYADVNGDRNPPVLVPPGTYAVHDLDLTGKKVLFVGDGPQVARIKYNGSGGNGSSLFKCGTAVGGAISHGGFQGLYLDGKSAGTGTPMCDNLYQKTGNTGHDLFWTLDNVSMANCTSDGFLFNGVIVNLHARKIRVDGAMGWGFRFIGGSSGEHRPITIDQFTVDCGGVGDLKGLMRVDNGQGYYVRLSNGRMEGNHNLLDETVSGTTEKSWVLNVNTLAGSYGAYYWLQNVMGFTVSGTTHALVRDASVTNRIRGRLDVVNFDNTQVFRADGRSGSNVGVISPQDMQTSFFSAG